MSNSPNVAAWLEIPDDCEFAVRYTVGGELLFMIGDGVDVLFEPDALGRFVALATEALAQPAPANPKADRPMLVSPAA
jgi:hypothetical protein